MSDDRVTQIRIQGMRSLLDVTLNLDGLTVLVGENGSGKSTIIEAFELLRQTPRAGRWLSDVLHNVHGGLPALLRHGEDELTLSARIDGAEGPLAYSVTVGHAGGRPEVRREGLVAGPSSAIGSEPRAILVRCGAAVSVFDPSKKAPVPLDEAPAADALVVAAAGSLFARPVFRRLAAALERIEVHPPWDVKPLWVAAEQRQRGSNLGMRAPVLVEEARSLDRLGHNLPNCYLSLRNAGPEVWGRVLEQVRMGLGEDLRDIRLPSPERALLGLELVFGGLAKPVALDALADGQLAYLAFVALAELGTDLAALVIDEPEVHLHPALLPRVVWMLEALAERHPVIVATHSDRLLDALTEPSRSVALCSLGPDRATRVLRPDSRALAQWLHQYRGLGQLRAEGYEPHVFTDQGT